MRQDDLQVILPMSQVQTMLTAVQQVPLLMSEVKQLKDSLLGLRSLYAQCLDKLDSVEKTSLSLFVDMGLHYDIAPCSMFQYNKNF